ncbi:hypothetical protein XBKQ1_850045 [Xenorhabdus bovienii str. kraussei Quebec]|uniref:Uncharacterized protein n=1 Tax=Xenorhabdus bovienii str. kraussei Quebec TaxID=1398203 RepID=A0A077PLL9_XENBV|nr:hypothetical protein XBKQ1_850045 [Xenorhabdus bovienii str. kraussei Quebec]
MELKSLLSILGYARNIPTINTTNMEIRSISYSDHRVMKE